MPTMSKAEEEEEEGRRRRRRGDFWRVRNVESYGIRISSLPARVQYGTGYR
jgi:hypothetical protein